jgi:RNA polymerase sigma-70 factor, ECF subfamily
VSLNSTGFRRAARISNVTPAAAQSDQAWSTATIDQHLNEHSVSFEAELRPLLGMAMRLATAMRLDRNDAEDAVQEASLRAWRRRENRRPGTELRPWFLAIVANQCRETRRARWASVLRFADPPERPAVQGSDAAGNLDITTALRRLPHDIRLAVVLRYYLDLSFQEVGTTSGCTVEAARSRVRRGLAALAATLTATETPP